MHLPTVAMLCLLLLLLVHHDEAFFLPVAPGAFGAAGAGAATILSPTAIAAIVAAGALGKLAGIVTGVVLEELGNRKRRSIKSQTFSGYGYETRIREAVPHKLTFAKLGIKEPEECFRRVFCAAATGK